MRVEQRLDLSFGLLALSAGLLLQLGDQVLQLLDHFFALKQLLAVVLVKALDEAVVNLLVGGPLRLGLLLAGRLRLLQRPDQLLEPALLAVKRHELRLHIAQLQAQILNRCERLQALYLLGAHPLAQL